MARRIFAGDRLPVVMQMRSTPCAISASASPSFAQQMPIAPAASCIFAMSALLWVLACGRVASPNRLTSACIFAMLASSRSRSTHRAGVSRSHLEIPMLAWASASRTATSPARVALDRPGDPHVGGDRRRRREKRAPRSGGTGWHGHTLTRGLQRLGSWVLGLGLGAPGSRAGLESSRPSPIPSRDPDPRSPLDSCPADSDDGVRR